MLSKKDDQSKGEKHTNLLLSQWKIVEKGRIKIRSRLIDKSKPIN